ncbi:MAG: HDIG domain-containing protein [Gemmatimonadetes bacterium]|nr:HDIG domain-containing protein [Gemmatimonadota bacterium]MYA64004.1 HDIG domain-containing protein [Gemmatimonadota bacterium]MYB99681.1 HDIG domain-containing protein [Gemmatimonadota bacterium]MYH54512.1 HDIG domain-containing protein [Gemmatimonadota bacterium]MYI45469.1 HDIG domain-containing protein [Gemmatimonadota bacterium]
MMRRRNREPGLLSRVPEKRWPDGVVHHGARWLLLVAFATGLVVIYPSDPGVGIGRHRAGTVAPRDIIARVDFQVPKDSAELRRQREEAEAAVVPTFLFQENARDSSLAVLGDFFAQVDSAGSADGVAGISAVLSAAAIDASPEQVEILDDRRRAASLSDLASAAIRMLTPDGVMSPNAAYQLATDSIRVVRDGSATVVARTSVLSGREFYERALAGREPGAETGLLRVILARYLAPSLVPDTQRTELDRAMARNAVQIVEARVLEGEAIVRANQQVGEAELRKLDAYRDRLRAGGISVDSSNVVGNLGGLVLNVLLLAVFGVLLFFFRPEIYRSFRAVSVIVGIFAIYFLSGLLVTGLEVPSAAMPIVFVAVSLSILWGGRLALLATLVVCSLTVVQEPFEAVQAFVILLVGGSAAALSVRTFRRLAQTWIFVAITAASFAVVILGFLLRGADFTFWVTLGWALGSTIAGAFMAIGFVPVFEWVTGITTEQTLIGWADANRPLLRRMAVEAPGTFAHTIQAANLAEAGAAAIGANALLCRAGVYYHDVGKIERPGHFIENQQGGNPHDRLTPLESAAVVRSHVTDGVRLARRERVPEVLLDFIREHHGDQTISFFLRRAREQSEREGAESPDPQLFRYPGPRPRSRETAIAMLADSTESAARVLADPTEERLRELIDGIFAAKARDGQLDDCTLTFQDITVLKRRFLRFLSGSYHRRISYPETQDLTTGEDGAKEGGPGGRGDGAQQGDGR